MSTLSDRLTGRPELRVSAESRTQSVAVAAEPKRTRPLLWSRVMQETRGRALSLARRAFPWRYY